MSEQPSETDHARVALRSLYDTALPHVYGYLLSRCGQPHLAEDLTAETFLAGVDAVGKQPPTLPSTPWLLGVARHKLADHWRRQAREQRHLQTVVADPPPATDDPWDERLDALRAHEILHQLAPQHRAALTLRYVDDLPVAEVASLLGRSPHATEALLVRARTAFRRAYTAKEGCGD